MEHLSVCLFVCLSVCLSVCLCSLCIYMLHIRYVAGLQAVEHLDANTVLENVDVTSLVKNHWDYRDKLHVLLQVLYSRARALSLSVCLSLFSIYLSLSLSLSLFSFSLSFSLSSLSLSLSLSHVYMCMIHRHRPPTRTLSLPPSLTTYPAPIICRS